MCLKSEHNGRIYSFKGQTFNNFFRLFNDLWGQRLWNTNLLKISQSICSSNFVMIYWLVIKLCAPKVNTTAEFAVSKVNFQQFFSGIQWPLGSKVMKYKRFKDLLKYMLLKFHNDILTGYQVMCPKSEHNGRIYIFKGQLSKILFGYLMTSGVKSYEIQSC